MTECPISHNRIKFMLWSASSAKVFAITPSRYLTCEVLRSLAVCSEINAEVISFRVRSADKRPSSCLQVPRDNKHRHPLAGIPHTPRRKIFSRFADRRFQLSSSKTRCTTVLKRRLRHLNAWRYFFQFLRGACAPRCNIMRFSNTAYVYMSTLISDELFPNNSLVNVTFTSRPFKVRERASGEKNSLSTIFE